MHGGTGFSGVKRMRLRYAGVCHLCGRQLPQRVEALYDKGLKKVRCLDCASGQQWEEPLTAEGAPSPASRALPPPPQTATEPPSPEPSPIERGRAGLGAQREYERRKARDEARTRQKWGRFGGIAVALSQEKQSTTAWALGAEGERRIGARLDRVAWELGGLVLHDRKIPGSRANIDHILVVPSGVWVIDAKKYTGKVEIRRNGGFFTPLVEKLTVRGRDCTSLVEQSLRQVELVREVAPTVPVTGVLCFEGAEWPLGGHLRTRGIQVLWPRRIKRVAGARTGAFIDVNVIGAQLATHFRATR
ncbi:nuclease-related domain-containing protein [Nesterenkonia halotolerans]|uniref:NERD domain-containing protein n=1 Tax=Nesterenkonia halotolerans TaxID=225325 RepID=A0ABR9J9L9_9MICC|nr:nuclease-related domain-containing protein [Nesterenkonia halotolerans]MBE1515700.1 hypothetical protein [Nesterenkonia halotolerans]